MEVNCKISIIKVELAPKIKCKLSIGLGISLNILEMSREKLERYLDWKKDIENIFITRNSPTKELILYLEEQLSYEKISSVERDVIQYLIYNLNSNGYLVDKKRLQRELKVEESIFNSGLERLKNFMPKGIGSESLRECLFKQIEDKENLKLREIIEFNLEDIASKNYLKIAKERELKLELVLKYVEEIKKLNPIPSRGYGDGELVRYIKPDICLTIKNKELDISLENDFIKNYISENKEDKLICSCLKKREKTLLEISKYILESQKEYFFNGKNLREIKIDKIALTFELHKSTIYRVIKDKYVQIDNKKIEPLKKFIGKGNERNLIKEEIKRILESNLYKSISDERVVKILAKMGYNIARRTVNKYRNELGIGKRYKKER